MQPAYNPTRSILMGGLTGFGTSLMVAWIPVVGAPLCCVTLVGTGLLAVWHRAAVTGADVPGGEGARMGAQAGLVAFVASTLFLALSWFAAGRPNLATQVRAYGEQLDAEVAMQVGPESVELVARALDTPLVVLGTVLVWVILCTILGTLGGAIGSGVFRQPGQRPGAA